MRSQTKVKAPATNEGHSTSTDQGTRSTPIVADEQPQTLVLAALKRGWCSPQCLCAISPKKGCKCACEGTMHGALLWYTFTPNTRGVTK